MKIIEHFKNRSIKDIAETLGMTSSAVTQLIDGLVRKGFVTRQEEPKDRRLVRLELSPKGKRHIIASNENRITEVAGLFDALSDSELKEYLHLQKKLLLKVLHKEKSL